MDNDDVITEIIANSIRFSATLNWFGADTLSLIVSDGILADTTDMIIIVTPVNDAPVLMAIPDTSIFEDDTLNLALAAVDIDNEVLVYNAISDTTAVDVLINDNILTLKPLRDWYGEARITVDVSDGERGDTVEFRFDVETINDPPAAFSLIAPADSIVNSSDTVMVFQWENSSDTDSDRLSYGIRLQGVNFDYATNCDTNLIGLNVLDIAVPRDIWISWNVFVTDSIDTTWSNETGHFTINGQLGTEPVGERPFSYTLYQNYPNPFNPTTIIRYDVPKASSVTLTIYNMNGQVVERLVKQKQEPGFYSVNWDARNVSTGVYFYRIQADNFQQVRKMLLVK